MYLVRRVKLTIKEVVEKIALKKGSCQINVCANEVKDKQNAEVLSCSRYTSKKEYQISNLKKLMPGKAKEIDQSVSYYSRYVRTGDELFIPQRTNKSIVKKFN